MDDMTSNNQNYSDLLNALSLILAVENLSENRQQSQYNDVHRANDEQAELLLKEINERFEKQNAVHHRVSEFHARATFRDIQVYGGGQI